MFRALMMGAIATGFLVQSAEAQSPTTITALLQQDYRVVGTSVNSLGGFLAQYVVFLQKGTSLYACSTANTFTGQAAACVLLK